MSPALTQLRQLTSETFYCCVDFLRNLLVLFSALRSENAQQLIIASESFLQSFHRHAVITTIRNVYVWQHILFTVSNIAARCFVPLTAEHLSRVTTCSVTRELIKKKKKKSLPGFGGALRTGKCFFVLSPNWTVETQSDFLWRKCKH